MSAPDAQRRQSRAIPLLLAVSGWIALGIVAAGGPAALRIFAVFAFTLICPGIAIVRLLPLRDSLERVVLALALSLSFGALVGEAAGIGHRPHPSLVLIVLASICTAAALAELVQGARARC